MYIFYAELIKELFEVQYSEQGSRLHLKEAYMFLADFLDECEGIYKVHYL